MAMSAGQRPRGCSTICLPFGQHAYGEAVADPAAFRAALDRFFLDLPELFPEAFAHGYLLKDSYRSVKLGLRIRRIECKATGEAFSGPSRLRPPLYGRPCRRGLRTALPSLLRRPLLGAGPRLRPRPRLLVPDGGRARPRQRRRHHPAPGRRARAPAGRRTPPDARRPEELRRHHRRRGLRPGRGLGANGWGRRPSGSLRRLQGGGAGRPARLRAPDSRRRRLGGDAPGVAVAVPARGDPALLPARLAQHPEPWQAERVVRGTVAQGVARLPRADEAVLRAAAAAAARMGARAEADRMAAGARWRSCAGGPRSTARRTSTPADTAPATCWTGRCGR